MTPKKERAGMDITLPSGKTAVMEECRGSDEDILTNKKYLNTGKAFDMVLLRRMISLDGEPVDQEVLLNLLNGDYAKILIEMRKSLYGPIVELEMTCSGCGEKSSWKINLDDLPSTNYPDWEELEVELPSGSKAIIKHATHRVDSKLIGRKDITHSEVMLLRLKSLDGKPVGLKTLQDMTGRDRLFLRGQMEEHTYGPDTEARFCCPDCGKDIVTRLEVESQFFFPKAR